MDTSSLKSLSKPLSHFLHRYHVMIFVIVVVGGLAAVVYILNTIIISSSNTDGVVPTATNTSFDQTTITKLNQLHPAGTTGNPPLPPGRINPFVE